MEVFCIVSELFQADCALDDNSSWSNVTGIHTLLQNYFRLHNDNLHIQTFIKEGVSALTQEGRTIEQLAMKIKPCDGMSCFNAVKTEAKWD